MSCPLPVRVSRSAWVAFAALLAGVLATLPARAGELGGLTFHAGDVDADPLLRELSLRRGVVVTYGRYRITSEALHLALRSNGVHVDGEGRVAFCPCADPPVALAFSGAIAAPPGDLIVRFPRLEVLGVPVLALPYLWVRSPERAGLLPPIAALRGDEGLLLGAGGHLPWRTAAGWNALDVTGGGFVPVAGGGGGGELGGRLLTPASTTRVVWDEVRGTRVAVDAHGAIGRDTTDGAALAWDADAIRGDRARTGTVDLRPAVQPWDQARADVAVRAGAAGWREGGGAIAALGAVGRGARGDGAILAGPRATFADGGAVGRVGAWDGSAVALAFVGPRGTTVPLSIGRASVELDGRAGPLEVRGGVAARGRAAEPSGERVSADAVSAARVEAALPFARSFRIAAGDAPLVHWIAPLVEARGALARAEGSLFDAAGRPVPRSSALAAGGLRTSLGAWTGRAVSLDVRGGALAEPTPSRVGRATVAADARVVGFAAEGAVVADSAALAVRSRLGPDDGAKLGVELAAQRGAGAASARAVATDVATTLPGDEADWLAAAATTGAASVFVPIGVFHAGARADADLDPDPSSRVALLAVRGSLGYAHRCGCLSLDAYAARRVGRDGVDVWVTMDLAPR